MQVRLLRKVKLYYILCSRTGLETGRTIDFRCYSVGLHVSNAPSSSSLAEWLLRPVGYLQMTLQRSSQWGIVFGCQNTVDNDIHFLGMRDIYITLMSPCCWAGLGGCLVTRVGLSHLLTMG